MKSNNQIFFEGESFALIGNSSKKKFPILTFKGLKKSGKTVLPMDPAHDELNGEKVYKSLNEMPDNIDHVIIETPKEETLLHIENAHRRGIKNIWVHMNCHTNEVLKYASDNNINLRHGTCAVMYVTPGLTYHSIHRRIMKLLKKY